MNMVRACIEAPDDNMFDIFNAISNNKWRWRTTDHGKTIGWEAQGQDISEFPYFERWFAELSARPAVVRGIEAGSELSVDYSKLSDKEKEGLRKLLYNQRARPAPKGGLL